MMCSPDRQSIVRVGLLAALSVVVCGCGGPGAKEKAASSQNMKMLAEAVITFHDANGGKWPDALADAKDQAAKVIADYGAATDFAKLQANPLTGDNPGYEYVKPKEGDPLESTVMLYQLRNGKRDTSLPVCYQSGSVRPMGK
jgi:hypothetical protein